MFYKLIYDKILNFCSFEILERELPIFSSIPKYISQPQKENTEENSC
jgi:hypothetical protein